MLLSYAIKELTNIFVTNVCDAHTMWRSFPNGRFETLSFCCDGICPCKKGLAVVPSQLTLMQASYSCNKDSLGICISSYMLNIVFVYLCTSVLCLQMSWKSIDPNLICYTLKVQWIVCISSDSTVYFRILCLSLKQVDPGACFLHSTMAMRSENLLLGQKWTRNLHHHHHNYHHYHQHHHCDHCDHWIIITSLGFSWKSVFAWED